MTPASYLFLCGDVQVRLGFVKEKVLIYVAAGFVARTGVVRLWLAWQMYLCKERTIDTEKPAIKESSTGQDTSVIFTDHTKPPQPVPRTWATPDIVSKPSTNGLQAA